MVDWGFHYGPAPNPHRLGFILQPLPSGKEPAQPFSKFVRYQEAPSPPHEPVSFLKIEANSLAEAVHIVNRSTGQFQMRRGWKSDAFLFNLYVSNQEGMGGRIAGAVLIPLSAVLSGFVEPS